jgi:hypothetical protein
MNKNILLFIRSSCYATSAFCLLARDFSALTGTGLCRDTGICSFSSCDVFEIIVEYYVDRRQLQCKVYHTRVQTFATCILRYFASLIGLDVSLLWIQICCFKAIRTTGITLHSQKLFSFIFGSIFLILKNMFP